MRIIKGWLRLGEPVALNVVNEYVSLYTKDQLQLVPQERPWGFTEEAEVLNGRLVRLASSPAAPPRRIDTHTPARLRIRTPPAPARPVPSAAATLTAQPFSRPTLSSRPLPPLQGDDGDHHLRRAHGGPHAQGDRRHVPRRAAGAPQLGPLYRSTFARSFVLVHVARIRLHAMAKLGV